MTCYHDILYDEHGQSVPLSADDIIEYILRCERDALQKQLDSISTILESYNHVDIIVRKPKNDF